MLHVCPAQAIKILNMIKMFGKPIRVNKASQDKRQADVGANLFIGNLDPDVDEKVSRRMCCQRRHTPACSYMRIRALDVCAGLPWHHMPASCMIVQSHQYIHHHAVGPMHAWVLRAAGMEAAHVQEFT